MNFIVKKMVLCINPILAGLPELHRWPGKGRFALPIVNCQKFVQTSAKPKKNLYIFRILGQV